MKRIAILTAGGDTPALNATLHGAVERANQLRIEVVGLIGGFTSLVGKNTPFVPLNPLYATIPELDPTRGGTILGSTREYMRSADAKVLDQAADRLGRLRVEGLICIGGDGTLNGMQTLCDRIPCVLVPKTIDNDLGLNYPGEQLEWEKVTSEDKSQTNYIRGEPSKEWDLSHMVNYVTPGYATAVFVAAGGVGRLRTTAESHRRIGIIEVMGRCSGSIALGCAYGQPDIVLIPESPLDVPRLLDRVRTIFARQQHVVIVCGEGIVDAEGRELGTANSARDPAGNRRLSGAGETLRQIFIEQLGDAFFRPLGWHSTAAEAIFTRKVGHTQRGGRPLAFDRFYAAQLGGKGVDLLLEGKSDHVATLQWGPEKGFHVDRAPADDFRDRWGMIHARPLHPSFYDPVRLLPAQKGIDYLLPIFTSAIGSDDVEYIRQSLFDSGNLVQPYHSINPDIARRTRILE
jgi:6-phosphofructokinase 1